MGFTPKDWKDDPDHTTPISQAALEDLEVRVTDYAEAPDVLEVGGKFGVNDAGTTRLPVNINTAVSGPAAIADGTSEVVGVNTTANFSGNFTGIGGTDPGYVWGWEMFAITGDQANDAAGITTMTGGNLEVAIRSPDTAMAQAVGATTGISWWGAAADGSITSMESLRVTAPTVKDGASPGTVTNAYGLFVEEVNGATVGASTGLSLNVDGGTSRFGGVCDIREASGGIVGLPAGALSIAAGYDASDPIFIMKTATGWDGGIYAQLKKANSAFTIQDGTDETFHLRRDGLPQWVTANQQTTVGAAGGASAPPATPVRYVKIKDAAGVTLVVPAYAAS